MQRVCFLARRLLRAAALAAFAGAAVAPIGCSSDSLATGAASPPIPADAEPARAHVPDAQGAGARPAQGSAIATPDAAGGAACVRAPLLAACSDGRILAILAAEFAARVAIAGAVRAALSRPSALDLAEKILTDDAVLGVQVEGAMRETGIASVPGGVERAIAAEALETIQVLGGESAPALDGSYVDREVLAHLRALGLIDRLLAPSAHDPRVFDLLARVRDLVVQHAQAASQAEAELEGSCAFSSTSSE